jgi:uncharacterized protein (TIGR03437 family)
MGSYLSWLGLSILPALLQAQSGVISTVAGQTPVNAAPVQGFSGDGGPAVNATLALANMVNQCDPNRFEQTSHISVDSNGNIYFADSNNQRIRRIDTSGTITTVAGSGTAPATNSLCQTTSPVGDTGSATGAHLFNPSDAIIDPKGNLIVADQQNNRIRQVNSAGNITTIVGSGLHNFYSPGIPATSSPMDWPSSLAIDGAGLIYFAELHGNRIGRLEANGTLSTLAGTGFPGFNGDGRAANTATLTKPAGIAIDPSGNLLIADTGNHRVRKVSGGIITTIAGTGQQSFCGDAGPANQACLDTPMDVKVDALGNIYIADTGNHRIRRIDASGTISTVAGTGQAGRGPDGVAAPSSALNFPSAVALDANNDLYIVDWQNYLIRKVTFSAISSGGIVISSGGIVNSASFTAPVSPGSIFSIFGTNLAPSTAASNGAPLLNSLSGVSVEVNGTPVPLYVVTSGQINAQLPYETAAGTEALVVATDSGRSAPANFTVSSAAPGIFVYPGSTRAIAANQDGTLNSPDNPESRGRVIVCYVTGLGAVDPPVPTGQSAPLDVLSRATALVSATIGDAPATVDFAGLAPTFVGLGQINVTVPDGAASGAAIPLIIEVAGQNSQTATISIR